MRQPIRASFPRAVLALVIVGFLIGSPASPSGFQVMTQGARATGMGLAFTGIADDPSAIFFNPAGLGFQEHFSLMIGGELLGRAKADFSGANPYPGVGVSESVQKQVFFLPHVYAVLPLTQDLNFGIGIDAPYGLGLRWNNPETFSGRFISQNVVIKTADVNPVFSFRLLPQLAIAAGADLRFSKVQLERNSNLGLVDPFTGAVNDVAHIKLNSDLTGNHGWGWNAGIMFKPVPSVGIGVAYRSHITIDYDGTAVFIQRPTGDPVFDALVGAQLPQGEHPVATSVKFPATLNIGAGIQLPAGFLLGLEADWTQWSDFAQLNISLPDQPGGDVCAPAGIKICRVTGWSDSWAYRVGLEKKFGAFAIRGGFYRDNTPQPTKDAGPILADNDRNVFTAGFGYDTDHYGIDVGGAYIHLKDRSVTTESTDNFFGRYSENAWVASASLRISF